MSAPVGRDWGHVIERMERFWHPETGTVRCGAVRSMVVHQDNCRVWRCLEGRESAGVNVPVYC